MRVRTHTNPLSYHQRFTLLDLQKLFPAYQNMLDFEIGFGRGSFIANYASLNPERFIVACEVRKAMLDELLARSQAQNLTNLLPLIGNGEICLHDMFADQTLDKIFIFHPDPWLKRRHQKRRVITAQFLALVARKLKPQGRLYLSTDVASLWQDMTETIAVSNLFEETSDPLFWATYYQTHWDEYKKDQVRQMACFCKK